MIGAGARSATPTRPCHAREVESGKQHSPAHRNASVRVNPLNCQPQRAFELGDLTFEDLSSRAARTDARQEVHVAIYLATLTLLVQFALKIAIAIDGHQVLSQ